MRSTSLIAMASACLLGCTTVDKSDPRPGGLAWTEDKAVSWMSGLGGPQTGRKAWVFVRVVAPPGATECRAGKSIFDGVNPYDRAMVDAKGEALLTVRNERAESSFRCRTPDGVVVSRTVASERIVSRTRDYTNTKDIEHGYWAVPPLVHIGPADAQAAARWDAVTAEVCAPDKPFHVCRDGHMQNMKARDLAG